jgi:D-cysteine desulfhydrase
MEMIPPAALLARWVHRRERCFVIAAGGSDPLGTLGYVDAALELAEQVAAGECPLPGTVHVAAGTLGTTAGLALGFAIAGVPTHIRATRITRRLLTNRLALRRLVVRTGKLLQSAGVPVPTADQVLSRVSLVHDQIGAGYGHPTPAAEACTGQLAHLGLTLDPTYTSKAAADALACLDGAGGYVHLLWQTLSAAHPPGPSPANAGVLPAPFRRYLGG